MSNELKSSCAAIDADMLYPDAWSVKLTFRDFTPNNFNMYANYYMNGFNKDEIASLAEKRGLVDMAKDLGSYLGEIGEQLATGASMILDDVDSALSDFSNSSSSLTNASMNEEQRIEAKAKAETDRMQKEKEKEEKRQEMIKNGTLSQEDYNKLKEKEAEKQAKFNKTDTTKQGDSSMDAAKNNTPQNPQQQQQPQFMSSSYRPGAF